MFITPDDLRLPMHVLFVVITYLDLMLSQRTNIYRQGRPSSQNFTGKDRSRPLLIRKEKKFVKNIKDFSQWYTGDCLLNVLTTGMELLMKEDIKNESGILVKNEDVSTYVYSG